MRIAYVMYPGACFIGHADGIKMQAEIWMKELVKKGHCVDLISPWDGYDWKSYDIIHVFGLGLWNYDFIHWGCGLNNNFVFSPIIDSNTPIWQYKLATHFGFDKLRLFSQNYALRKLEPNIKLFMARTKYEAKYLEKGYGIEPAKVAIVPLSYRNDFYNDTIQKESFCLFVGTMTQPRKNVFRLIEAAKLYGFQLVLVGNTGNEESLSKLKKRIGNYNNIEIKGYVNDEELNSLYNKAKVFALPSINEGVGLVALEAAIHGCNIVITNLGGPKEYYPQGLAELINPYDINDIGKAIMKSLKDNNSQPKLRNYLMANYNISICVNKLIETYNLIIPQEHAI